MKTYAIILSAGKQTRMEHVKQKCLFNYNGHLLNPDNSKMTILEANIFSLQNYVEKIFVVLNSDVNNSDVLFILDKYSKKYNVEPIMIKSGRGNGHATYEAIKEIKKSNTINDDDLCVLMWGDSIQDNSVVLNMLKDCSNNLNNDKMVIPLNYEKECYMKFEVDNNNNVISAHKPKTIEPGYHDYSIFLFKTNYIYDLLSIYVGIYNDNNIKKEIDFIQLFNYCPNTFKAVFPGVSSINAFNTVDEYTNLQNIYKI